MPSWVKKSKNSVPCADPLRVRVIPVIFPGPEYFGNENPTLGTNSVNNETLVEA